MSFLSAPEKKPSDFHNVGVNTRVPKQWDSSSARLLAADKPLGPARHNDPVATKPLSVVNEICRRIVNRKFEQMPEVRLAMADSREHTTTQASFSPMIRVHDPCFFRRAVLGGSLGAAESYVRGEWSADDLVEVMRILARNMGAVSQIDRGMARLLGPVRSCLNWLHLNTRAGSRRNIAAHYDLSNEFFSLMLDPTMTYSAGIFDAPSATMQQASLAKYDRICCKLELSSRDHVLEVGTGWGGFAIHAAENYGCRVTTTTISREQYHYSRAQIRRAKLSDRVTLLRKDYRDLSGQYDKLVSIEMIEAVGERFFDGYFRQCSQLLKPDGMMLLQAIMIPDHRYDAYRRSVDFIQRYIFPGGFLPSFSAIGQSLRRHTNFRLFHNEDFGPHYAETLARWRKKFWQNIEGVRALGFDDRFIRMWDYYLCYCEAGFHERQIGVSQLLLTKPACRRAPILADVSQCV